MAQTIIFPHNSSGYVRYIGDASWTTTREAITGTGTLANGTLAGQDVGATYEIYRQFYKFDLSGIPANATITGATLGLYPTSKDTTLDFWVTVGPHTAPDETLAVEDYDLITLEEGVDAYAPHSALVSGISLNAYFTLTLNATAITAAQAVVGSGYFKINARHSADSGSTTPPDVSFVIFDLATNKPKLTLTFTLPKVGGYSYFM